MVGWICIVILDSVVSRWMKRSSSCFFPFLILTRPSCYHQSCMWNTTKSGQCPPEFSLTFLGHNDKSQHWACLSYLDLKTSYMTFWLPLTVNEKKGICIKGLSLFSIKRNSKVKRTYIGLKTFIYNNDSHVSRWNTFSSDKTTFDFWVWEPLGISWFDWCHNSIPNQFSIQKSTLSQ